MANGKNTTKKAPQRETAPALIAWYVAERGEKRFWTRIGAAWNHEDGEGMTVRSFTPSFRRPAAAAFDIFYKRLIETIPLKNVTSRFALENVKCETAFPIACQG
jgi:hypothetical protein